MANLDIETPGAEAASLATTLRDAADVYSKAQSDSALALKADASNVFTKSEVTAALALELDISGLDAAIAGKPLATAGVDTILAVKGVQIVQGHAFSINACDHGVKTSNTRAENSARLQEVADIALEQPNGGRILLPAGFYQFDPATQVQFLKTTDKTVEFVGDGGTVIDVGSSITSIPFYVGSPSGAGGDTNFVCRDLRIVGGSSITGKAFQLENANGAIFERVRFQQMLTFAELESSYAVEFVGCLGVNVGGATVYSSDTCHHLTFDRCKNYNAGVGSGAGMFVQMASGVTDNLIIENCVFEGCRQLIRSDDGLATPVIHNNYIEFTTVDPFNFGAGVSSLVMSSNWFSLGLAFDFHHWTGGAFVDNNVYNQAIGFASDCADVHVDGNYLRGTGSLDTSNLLHTISAFLNGATGDATYPPAYAKSDGIVQLFGFINSIPGGGLPAFNLPIGYRPKKVGRYPAVSNSGAFTQCVVDGANGNVSPSGTAGSGIYLDGIMFKSKL